MTIDCTVSESHNIDFTTYKHLGFVSRGNTEFVGGTISDANWRTIRNTANTANLSILFEASGAKVMVDMSIVIWGADDAYKELRCLMDGVPVGEVISASYLKNGVAPGMGMIEFTPTPGSHTLTFQWRKNGGPNMAVSYRNFSAKAYELVGGN